MYSNSFVGMFFWFLVAAPDATLAAVARFLDLCPADIPAYGRGLPEVNVVSAPGAEKWRAEADALATVAPILAPVMARLGYKA